MKYLSVIAVGVYLMAFLFVVYAVASSARPDRHKQRAVEFGTYFVLTALLTAGNTPPASLILSGIELQPFAALLAILRTLIVSIMLVRLGVIALRDYGRREAMKKHIAKLEGGKVVDV